MLTMTCCSKVKIRDGLEAKICQCIYNKHDSIGIDIKKELLKYEQHLIENACLIDTTGKSYIQVFEVIARENASPFNTDYSIDGLSLQSIVGYGECFYSQKESPELAHSNSKMKELYSSYDSIASSGDISPSKIALILITVLDASDFDKELFRIHALHTFYFTTNPRTRAGTYSLPASDKPFIQLTINSDQEIHLNNTLTPLDSLKDRVNQITKTYSEDELANFYVQLTVDNEVKMGVVTEVKRQLRETKALRIEYKTKDSN